uniref:Uncharacterized protein n=1 Tax=Anguilla anguilla TaxID=7936 RepID=A0A0E9QK90_ANGAN
MVKMTAFQLLLFGKKNHLKMFFLLLFMLAVNPR